MSETTQTSVTSQTNAAGIPPTDPLYQEAVKAGLLPPEPVPGEIQPYKISVETTVRGETTRTTTHLAKDTPCCEGTKRTTALFTTEAAAYTEGRAMPLTVGFLIFRVALSNLCLYTIVPRQDTDLGKQVQLRVGDRQPYAVWIQGQPVFLPGVVTLIAL